MSQNPTWDPDGEVRRALAVAVADYGHSILGNPEMLRNLLLDLVPDWPREIGLLVAATSADVATTITERIGGQGLDPAAAVRLTVADMLVRAAVDADGAAWAVTETGRALGLSVPATPPPMTTQGPGFDATQASSWVIDPLDAAGSQGADIGASSGARGPRVLRRPAVVTGIALATAAVIGTAVAFAASGTSSASGSTGGAPVTSPAASPATTPATTPSTPSSSPDTPTSPSPSPSPTTPSSPTPPSPPASPKAAVVATPPAAPSTPPSTSPSSPPAPVLPINGVYSVTLNADVGGITLQRQGTVRIGTTTSGQHGNPVDVCLESGDPLGNPTAGAVWFGTNTACFPSKTIYDLAQVTTHGLSATATVDPDPNVARSSANSFDQNGGLTACFYTIIKGTMSVTTTSAGHISGSFDVTGDNCGQLDYQGSFTGALQ